LDVDLDKVARNPFMAGALGALATLRFAPGASWWERATNVLAGSVCAGYCAPALAEWWRITQPGIHAALAFGVGMFGLSLAAAITQGIRDTRVAEIIAGWLSRSKG